MPCGVQKYQAGITTKCVIKNKPSVFITNKIIPLGTGNPKWKCLGICRISPLNMQILSTQPKVFMFE